MSTDPYLDRLERCDDDSRGHGCSAFAELDGVPLNEVDGEEMLFASAQTAWVRSDQTRAIAARACTSEIVAIHGRKLIEAPWAQGKHP